MKVVREVLLICIASLSLGLTSSIGKADVPLAMAFQAWKASRVDEAKAVLEKVQKPASIDPLKKPLPGLKSTRVDQKLQQAQLNLDIAQELSVNDYFVLYLTQFKQRDAFVEVAKKLTPEEIADLMMAYQKHLSGSSDIDLIAPSTASLGGPVTTTK
jgi:hypothetical protein